LDERRSTDCGEEMTRVLPVRRPGVYTLRTYPLAACCRLKGHFGGPCSFWEAKA
jgi:hypothetical protein